MHQNNIVLIVMDTLRYQGGPFHNTSTPFTFPGSENFLMFHDAITPAPWTLPAHVSLFTGLYLRDHGIHESAKLKESFDLFTAFSSYKGSRLPEDLRAKGYTTYGAVANTALMPGTGFDIGFDQYEFIDFLKPFGDDQINLSRSIKDSLIESEKSEFVGDSADLDRFLKRLRDNGDEESARRIYFLADSIRKIAVERGYPDKKGGEELVNTVKQLDLRSPFFLFMNFMEAHDPYDISGANLSFGDGRLMLSDLVHPGRLPDPRKDELLRKYSESVIAIRELITSLIRVLKEKDAYDDTMIILTSDHGQSFREQDFYGHGTFLYDHITRIPLSIKLPSQMKYKQLGNDPGRSHISLTSIRRFINESLDTTVMPESLFSKSVYSESYGIPNNYPEMFGNDSPLSRFLEKHEHKRLAVFNRSGKMTVNTESGEIEELSVENKSSTLDAEKEVQQLIDDYEEFTQNEYDATVPSQIEIRKILGRN